MLDGWREEEWWRTALVCATIMNASMNRKKGQTFKPQSFHPFMAKAPKGIPLTKETFKGFATAWVAGRKRRK